MYLFEQNEAAFLKKASSPFEEKVLRGKKYRCGKKMYKCSLGISDIMLTCLRRVQPVTQHVFFLCNPFLWLL